MHFSKTPIKIYLDQKDYSRIGKGLVGNQKCDTDLTVYHFLIKLVNSGKIRIYFSWCHFIEALKYEQEIDIVEPYCQVIDSLTQGHCIKWIDALQKTELELFLSRQFNFNTSISDDYPYGKFVDALPFTDDLISDFQKRCNLIEIKNGIKIRSLNILNEFKQFGNTKFLKEVIKQTPKKSLYDINNNLSSYSIFSKEELVDLLFGSLQNQENLLEKLLGNDDFLKELIKQTPNEYLLSFSESFPGFDFSNEELINFLFGNPQIQKKLIRKYFDRVSSFKNFVLKYSKLFPQVKKMGDLFKDTRSLSTAIMFMQAVYDINPNLVNEKNIYDDLIHKYIEYFTNDLNNICNKHNLDREISKKFLADTKFKGMPSINSLLTYVIEYYKRHKGNLIKGRKPESSDIMDLYHIRNLPYVDIYSTDSFFGEFAKKRSIEFRTQVVTSLVELKDVLEKKRDHSLINPNFYLLKV